jgi:hypothetical protein
VVAEDGDDLAWALLAVGSPRPSVDLGSGRIESFGENDQSTGHRRSQMLVAALAGLGRISNEEAGSLASALGASLGGNDRWSQRIDQAARDRAAGTVVLLAAAGMQTDDWHGVPPAYLFRIVRALRTVGLEFEARMIAAEAITRL